MAAHRLPDVTVVADAGMISEANQKAIEAEGLSFILGMKVPDIADRLFISRATVKTHLSHIFTKLDVINRAQLVALATRATADDTPARD
jgi:ATP/maltotriose-dependent transcriptional regulator MalT